MNRQILFIGLFWLTLSGSTMATGIISGIVMDVDTNEPIANATCGSERSSSKTDSQGNYILAVTAGKHRLSCQALGYSPVVKFVTVADDVTETANFELLQWSLAVKAKEHANKLRSFFDEKMGVDKPSKSDIQLPDTQSEESKSGFESSTESQEVSAVGSTNSAEELVGKGDSSIQSQATNAEEPEHKTQ